MRVVTVTSAMTASNTFSMMPHSDRFIFLP